MQEEKNRKLMKFIKIKKVRKKWIKIDIILPQKV